MRFGIDGVDLILSMCIPNNNTILCDVGLRLDVNTGRRFVPTRKKKTAAYSEVTTNTVYPIFVGETIYIFLTPFGPGQEFTQSLQWMPTFFPRDKMTGT
jgi:hypothetical protein